MGRHFGDKFYKTVSSKSFQEISDSLKMDVKDMEPQYSLKYNLCEYLFRRGKAA